MANIITRSDERNRNTLKLSFTGQVARWSAQHRWWVVAASVMIMALAMFVSSAVEPGLEQGL